MHIGRAVEGLLVGLKLSDLEVAKILASPIFLFFQKTKYETLRMRNITGT